MKKIPLKNFNILLTILISAVLLGCLFQIYKNENSLNIQIRESANQVVEFYNIKTSERLKEVEDYSFGELVSDQDIAGLRNGIRTSYRVYNISQKMVGLHKYFEDMDGFFFYDENSDILIHQIWTGNSRSILLKTADRSQKVKESIRNICSDQYVNQWNLVNIDGIWTVILCKEYKHQYMGAIMMLDSLIHSMITTYSSGDRLVAVISSSGEVLAGNTAIANTTIDQTGARIRIDNRQYLQVVKKMNDLPLSICLFIPQNRGEIWTNAHRSLAILSMVAIVVVGLFMLFQYYILRRPLDRLDEAIRNYSSDMLNDKVKNDCVCKELYAVTESFNQMTSQIANLKIDAYEKQIENERINLQYLQIQMNPHFFLNILNVIYSLARTGNVKKIAAITLDLISYTRYILSVKEIVVPLSEELTFVSHYINIQRERVSYDVDVSVTGVSDEVSKWNIPPLTIQTFIENAFKYAVPGNKRLEICVNISIETQNEEVKEKRLHIDIEDSGNGFSEELLTTLNNNEPVPADQNGEHYGINNIINRIRILYGNDALVSFSNNSNGGGKISLYIPDVVKNAV